MQYDEHSPFYKLLATKYKQEEEALGITIVEANPKIAELTWPGPIALKSGNNGAIEYLRSINAAEV